MNLSKEGWVWVKESEKGQFLNEFEQDGLSEGYRAHPLKFGAGMLR